MAETYDDLLKALFSLTRNTTRSSNMRHSPSASEDIVEDEDGDDDFLDDYENDYEDHITKTSDIEIDNSNLSYIGKNICIKLNSKNTTRISKSEKVLCDKFSKLKEIPSGNRMEKILTGLFPEGFSKHQTA